MRLFRHRHLAFGLIGFIVSLVISYYMSTLFRVLVLLLSLGAVVCLITVYLIKRKKSMLDKIIKCALLCFFIALSMMVSILSFGRDAKIEKYYGEEKSVHLIVEKPIYERSYESRYKVKIKEIDGAKINAHAILTLPNSLNINDEIELIADLKELSSQGYGFDERQAYLDEGITSALDSDSEPLIIYQGDDNDGIFERLNSYLSKIYEDSLSKDTASVFTSLLLGNTKNLNQSIRRDFSRVGISHILALSGMHIALICALVGFLLTVLNIPNPLKIILLVLSTVFFVFLTGFSPSCVRAGIMMCLFWSFSLLGYKTDLVTSLFVSVSLMLLFNPYLIFSLSLQLSFLAMLGCLVSSAFLRKIRLWERVRNKPLKRLISVLVGSLFVIGFTAPICALNFSSISLLTPISNLIFVPIFTGIIYFAPFLLVLLKIPFLAGAASFLSNHVVEFLLDVIRYISSLSGISMPIYAWAQLLGIVVIALSLVFLMMSNKKQLIASFLLVLFGFAVLFVASGANGIVKMTTSHVSAYSENGNDYIFIEAKGKLSVIDISKSSEEKHLPAALVSKLGYTEIENYVLLDYSHKSNEYLNAVTSVCLVKNLYLQSPDSTDEEEMNMLIRQTLSDERINIFDFGNDLELNGYKMNINPNDKINRSERRSVSFTLEIDGVRVAYLGSASYEIFDYYTAEKSYDADVLVFGSYGPTYKQSYFYEMNSLDCAIYMGNSYDFATEEHKNATQGKDFIEIDDIVRIKIKSP